MIKYNAWVLQKEAVRQMERLKGAIVYTQDERRYNIEEGYGDCSSVVRWVFLKVMNIDIGDDTAMQIMSNLGKDVDLSLKPDENLLEPGDLLFFTGNDIRRPFCVGHVEMYAGKNCLLGQNDREEPGVFEKNLDEYLQYLESIGSKYIKAKRFIR